MAGPVSTYGTQIGRQFWVAENADVFNKTEVSQTSSDTGSKTTESAAFKPPDTSFVNYLRAGGLEKFGGSICAAERMARRCGSGSGDEVRRAENTAASFGVASLDDLAKRVVETAYGNEKLSEIHGGHSYAETLALAKTSLVKLFSMQETEELVQNRADNKVSDKDWRASYAEREKSAINAALGIMELIRDGKVSENSIVHLKRGQVYSVSNLDDLLEITSKAAESAKAAFIGQEGLNNLLGRIREKAAYFTGEDSNMRLYGEKVRNGLEAADRAIRALVAARTAAVKDMVTGFPTVGKNGKPLSEKQKKKALDAIRDSNRSFRYSMDTLGGKVSASKMTRMRRWFDNLFGTKTGAVSKEAYRKCAEAENALSDILDDLDNTFWYDPRTDAQATGWKCAEYFDDMDAVTRAATDLTHEANDVVRNYKNNVYTAFDNHAKAMRMLFDKSLAANRNQTYGMVCTVGVGAEADLGIAKISARADRKRDVVVTILDTGAVRMTVLDGAAGRLGLAAGTSFGEVDADVGGSYQKGRTFAWDSFDEFVNDSFGKLGFPAPADTKDNKELKKILSGGTGGNTFTKLMRTIGFLSFGSRVDTHDYANKIRRQGVYGQIAEIVGSHAPKTNADYRTFRKRAGDVHIGVSVGTDDTKKLGVDGTVRAESEDQIDNRVHVDFFEGTGGYSADELKEAFSRQLERIETLASGSSHWFARPYLMKTDFESVLRSAVARQAPDGSQEPLPLDEAADRILSLIDVLQADVAHQAPKDPDFAARHWTDYATCLRACALAETLLQRQAEGTSDAGERTSFARVDRAIRSAVRGLRDAIPPEIYEQKVLLGTLTFPDPPRTTTTIELGVAGASSSLAGRLIIDGPGDKAADPLRPWLGMKTYALEIEIERPKSKKNDETGTSESSETSTDKTLKDRIVAGLQKALQSGAKELDGKIGKIADKFVQKAKEENAVPDSDVRNRSLIRFEFDAHGHLSALSSRKLSTVEESKKVGKGNVNVHREKTFVNVRDRFAVFFDPSLEKMLLETERRLGNEFGTAGNKKLATFMNQNKKSVIGFLDDFVRNWSPTEKRAPESGKSAAATVHDSLVKAFETLHRIPRLNGLANAYIRRLNDLIGQTKDLGRLDECAKLRLGSEHLVLTVQLLRFAAMASSQKDSDEAGLTV